MVTSNLETAGAWRGWNLCFYPCLNHTIINTPLYVVKIVDWGSFKLKLKDRLPSWVTCCSETLPLISCTVNEIWSRHSLHASSCKAFFSWLDGFSCRSMAGNILHHGFYGGQRATFSQSRKLDLCRDTRWFAIPNILTFIHLQCRAVRQFLVAHGVFGIGGCLDGHYRAHLVLRDARMMRRGFANFAKRPSQVPGTSHDAVPIHYCFHLGWFVEMGLVRTLNFWASISKQIVHQKHHKGIRQ